MQPIPELDAQEATRFRDEVLLQGRPVVYRGLVAAWPLVAAARRSPTDFCSYIKQFDRGYEVDAMYGPPSIRGRLFYNEDLSGLNCRKEATKVSASLDYLLAHAADDPSPTLAIQSVVIDRYLPGLRQANPAPATVVPEGADARLWLGTRAVVAAHFDPSENLACCVAGRRRFTLFPPEQVANLYVGPFELTPAGATISLVDFDQPDLARFPRFTEALDAAWETELGPGDAVYVPYLWWHHVRALDGINGLMNFWWAAGAEQQTDPRNVLMHALMAIRTLPPAYRDAWRSMFAHYVFSEDGASSAHLPAGRRGIIGEPSRDELRKIRLALARALSRN